MKPGTAAWPALNLNLTSGTVLFQVPRCPDSAQRGRRTQAAIDAAVVVHNGILATTVADIAKPAAGGIPF